MACASIPFLIRSAEVLGRSAGALGRSPGVPPASSRRRLQRGRARSTGEVVGLAWAGWRDSGEMGWTVYACLAGGLSGVESAARIGAVAGSGYALRGLHQRGMIAARAKMTGDFEPADWRSLDPATGLRIAPVAGPFHRLEALLPCAAIQRSCRVVLSIVTTEHIPHLQCRHPPHHPYAGS